MITNLQSLDGKSFIVVQPIDSGGDRGLSGQHGDRHSGATRLWRGRILGQIVSELIPVWLCDVYPIDTSELTVRTQTLLPLETLIAGWLYDDKEIWEIEFREMLARLEAAAAEARKAAAAAVRQQKAILRAATANGVRVVGLEELIGSMVGSAEPVTGDESTQ